MIFFISSDGVDDDFGTVGKYFFVRSIQFWHNPFDTTCFAHNIHQMETT
jgi:hypothetical protein